MRRVIGIPVAILTIVSAGCDSPSTRPSTVETRGAAALPAWLKASSAGSGPARLRSSAVIDGFRVHPDPGDDGVIHAFTDENVVVNATDIASRPPAEPNYLVVNWGDGPNQRVGCGPCRQDHGYAAGRYTLVASLDGPSGRSITVPVEVTTRRERSTRVNADGPIQPFTLGTSDIAVGETVFLVVPFFLPPTVSFAFLLPPDCSPPNAAVYDFANAVIDFPNTASLPIIGQAPGTCTITAEGEDTDGNPFSQSLTLTIH
jgi:hypothetical protein